MSYQYTLMRTVRKAIDDVLARWNPFIGDAPITVPQAALPPPEQSPYAGRGTEFDARKFWGRPLQEGAPAEGDAYLWSDDAAAFVLGAAAGAGGGSGAGFRAHLDANLVMTGPNQYRIPMRTIDYDTASLYNTGQWSWTPPAGPVAFAYRIRTVSASGDVTVELRKNDTAIYSRTGGRYSFDGSGWVESVVMDLAAGADSYTLHIIMPSGDDAELVSVDTFWSGMSAGGSGTGGGGGGGADDPIPADVYHAAGTVHELIDELFAAIRALQSIQSYGFGFGGFGENPFGL